MRRSVMLIVLLAALAAPLKAGATVPGRLAITPASGPVGTTFVVTGDGFTGQGTVRLIAYYLTPTASGGRGEQHVVDQTVLVDGSGAITLRIDSAGFTPADYTVIDATAPGQAGAHFTVIGGTAPIPGLPNTGAGAMRRESAVWPLALLLLGLVLLTRYATPRRMA